MIKEIIECDGCRKKAKPYIIIVGKEPDPSGNGYINIEKYHDFCLGCLIDYVRANKDYKIFERKI